MKKSFLILVWLLALLTACKDNEQIIYNTTLTPDLSNPLIQKLTASKWYRAELGQDVDFRWTSTHFNKAAEVAEQMLYYWAWIDTEFLKDGSVWMTFKPPLFENSYVLCKGKWKVSETEENTVIIQIKTPVSYETMRFKIIDFQSKDNVAIIKVLVDTGNRLIEYKMMNAPGEALESSGEAFLNPNDHKWLETKKVQTAPLKESDVVGVWTNSNFEDDDEKKGQRHTAMVTTYVDDFMMRTPVFLLGMQFQLDQDGKAKIVYGKSFIFWDLKRPENDKQRLFSNATWRVVGHKIIIESNEHVFYPMGYVALGFSISNTVDLVPIKADETPVQYLFKHYYYVMELMEYDKEADKWLFRISSDDGVHYAYLDKSTPENDLEWTNIKHIYN